MTCLLLCLKLDLPMSGMLSVLNSQVNCTKHSICYEEQAKLELPGAKRSVSLELLNFNNYQVSFIFIKPDFFTKGNKGL